MSSEDPYGDGYEDGRRDGWDAAMAHVKERHRERIHTDVWRVLTYMHTCHRDLVEGIDDDRLAEIVRLARGVPL